MFVWPRWIHMGSLHVSHNLDCQKLPIIMGNHLKTISTTEPFPTFFLFCFLHRVNDPITMSLWFFLYIIVVRTTLGITQWNFLLDLDSTIYVCPHLILFLKTHYSNPFPFYVSLKFALISHRKLILISF